MSTRGRIVTNTAINIANTAVGFIVAFAMTPVIIGRMGTEGYGIWVFLGIFSIAGYLSLLDFGLQSAAIKFVAEFKSKNDHENLRQVVSTIVFFFTAAGVAGGLILLGCNHLFLTSLFNIPEAQRRVVIVLIDLMALNLLFQFPVLGFSAILEGLQRYDYLRGVGILMTLAGNAVIYLFLKRDGSLLFMTAVLVASSLLLAALYGLCVIRLLPEIRIRPGAVTTAAFRRLFAMSSKLFLWRIVGLVFNSTDRVLIAIFLTVANQTEYDVVNKTHIILLSILSIFNQAALPAASELSAQERHDDVRMLLTRSTKYASALALPALLFLMAFPGEFLGAWVGADFAGLGGLVRLYCAHVFLTMLVGVSSTMLVSVNRVGEGLRISIWAAALNLVISVATVRYLGLAGLILGTTVAYAISSAIYMVRTNAIFGLRNREFLRQVVLPVLPAAFVTALALAVARFTAGFSSLGGWVLFGVGLYLVFLAVFFFTGLAADERGVARDALLRLTRRRAPGGD